MFARIRLTFSDGSHFDSFAKDKTIKDLFFTGRRLVRTARHEGYYLTVSITDVHTNALLFRFYHMPDGGKHSTRLNGNCKYGGKKHQGLNL